MEKVDDVNHYELPFDLKLTQVEGHGEQGGLKPIASTFVEFKTVRSFSEKERVLRWNLPLVALQRKIGEDGRFVLPEKGVIDDVFNFTLNDYRVAVDADITDLLTIFWIKRGASSKGESEKPDGSDSNENDKKTLDGPMKEKDWDYVFQANRILHCSLVNPETSRIERASHAAFRLKTSNEDDAEADLPQDDERAKIPVWTLASEPSRAYIRETNYELETSATLSGHSKKSFNIGVGGSYKKFSGEGKYERTTEKSYKDESTYGRKQNTMLTFYEIPIVELSLHKSNCRLSDPCRQHLVKLRDRRSFDDLMEFFNKYGTVYANKVVLGGRLINTKLFYQETMSETQFRQENVKTGASLSIGIDVFSVKGGYSDEHGTQGERGKSEKTDQTKIDWTGYGGNAALVSDPTKWLPTVPEYRNWKIVENAEVESIQDFIGSLPGYEDIPGLFQDILASGLYSPEIVHLGPRPQLPGQKSKSDDLDTAVVGTAVNTLAIPTERSMEYPFASALEQDTSSKILAKGGVSWQVLDSKEAVRLEIMSVMQSLMNAGANRSVIPKHLYHLSMRPCTISVILQWSSDLVEKGFNLAFPGAAQMGKTYRTLNQLAPTECAEVMQKAAVLSTKDFENTRNAFQASLDGLANKVRGFALAAFRLDAWKRYLLDRLNKPEAGKDEFFLDTIRNEAKSMPDEDMGQDSSSMSPFTVSPNNIALLKGNDVAKCTDAMGHGFLESYTQKASMTGLWTLTLPHASAETFYAFRMMIQKYFFQPRGISEVCDFFTSPAIFKPAPAVKVSIFGYRDRSSKLPEDVLDKPPEAASSYFTPQVLSRNTERQTIKVRAWKGLQINELLPPDDSLLKEMTPAAPEEFFVLNVQKAERLLLLLVLYSNDGQGGVDKSRLDKFGEILDKILGPGILDRNGMMSKDGRDLLAELVRDLEKALPEGDPEKDPK